MGDTDIFSKECVLTPEITNIGSYDKGWRLLDNMWVLSKAGSPLEIWSEIFTSKLAQELNLSAVDYKCVDGFSFCHNFVPRNWDFEPAKSLVGDDNSNKTNLPVMERLGLVKPYLDILFMDAIVRNGDRHEFNYGFLTNEQGKINLATNFDNNMAMFWNGIPLNLERDDVMVRDFIDAIKICDYSIPHLNSQIVENAYHHAISDCKFIELPQIPIRAVVDFCMNAYNRIYKYSL